MNTLALFTVFHLNMAYSSIEEEMRPEVVRRCYWPLLRLAADFDVPVGVEAPGYTLETIAAIDPVWVETLKTLLRAGLIEFVGSGYAQIIGPLVPADVNAANLRLGHEVYERLLGFCPEIALINEQAYSAGLVQHYLGAGYRAIVMEWENPASHHPEWNPEWRYLPQFACGQHGEVIPLIWNQSIAFQKFQRYAHGEMDLAAMRSYLVSQTGDRPRALALYANDAEVFDFRPGRFHTEAALQCDEEWQRVRVLFEHLKQDERFRFTRPSHVLDLMSQPANRLHLESAEAPIPVKKQAKYNVTRWAVTGRNDLMINTALWRIYRAIRARKDTGDDDWRELCYLWSSDFRTHIREARWRQYVRRLATNEERWATSNTRWTPSGKHSRSVAGVRGNSVLHGLHLHRPMQGQAGSKRSSNRLSPREGSNGVIIETDEVELCLNPRRGLAIEHLAFKRVAGGKPLCGTLPHGYFDNIALAADYYTGHVVFEAAGQHKITDLGPVEPNIEQEPNRPEIVVHASVQTPLGLVAKKVHIFRDAPRVELAYRLDWPTRPVGSLRLGHVTLIPTTFKREELFFRTHQGGTNPETFRIRPSAAFDHGSAVSSLVTANQAVALTGGVFELGDDQNGLRIETDHSLAALVAMIRYFPVANSFLCRLCFSADEVDDTRKSDDYAWLSHPLEVRLSLSPLATRASNTTGIARETAVVGS